MDKQKIPTFLAIVIVTLWILIQLAPYVSATTGFPPFVVGIISGVIFIVIVKIAIVILC